MRLDAISSRLINLHHQVDAVHAEVIGLAREMRQHEQHDDTTIRIPILPS